MEIRPNELVSERACIREMAENLGQQDSVSQERERPRNIIAGSLFEPRVIDSRPVDAGRSSGLEATELQAEGAERVGERFCGRLAEPAADRFGLPAVHESTQERSGSDDDSAGGELR